MLPGLILSDFSHFDTLVTNPAQSGRIAACAMPPHPWPKMASPIFVISDDGGRTWQQRAIPVVGMAGLATYVAIPLIRIPTPSA